MVMCSMQYIFLHSGWTSYSADRHTTAEQPHRTDVTTDICHATHVRGQEGYPEKPVFKMSSKSTLLWWGWYYENFDYHHAWMFLLVFDKVRAIYVWLPIITVLVSLSTLLYPLLLIIVFPNCFLWL